MGRPQTDAAAYARSSSVADAGKVDDPLLLIHGMVNDDVVFTNSTEIIAQLQQEFGLARGTALRAVDLLRQEGLVRTVAGRGTFVVPRPASK